MNLQVYRDKAQRRRWIVVSSSDALDRDKEIIPVEALKADAERAKQTGEYGPLLWWHVKGLELGTCDFNEMAGNKLVESGTFKSEAIADFVEKNADQLGVSIGFVHSPNDPGPDGVFKAIRRTERSLLPAQRASNPDARVLAVKGKGPNVTVRDVKQTHKWGPFVEMMFGGDEKAAEDYLAQFGAEAGKSAGTDSEKGYVNPEATQRIQTAVMNIKQQMAEMSHQLADAEDNAPYFGAANRDAGRLITNALFSAAVKAQGAAGVAPRWQMASSAVYAAHAAAAEFRNAVENADSERNRAMGKEAGKSRDGGEQWDNDGWGDGVDPATVMKQPPAGKFGDHDPISALMGGKE